MICLTLPELLHVAERGLGSGFGVRDYDLVIAVATGELDEVAALSAVLSAGIETR